MALTEQAIRDVIALRRAGNYAGALASFEELLKEEPSNAWVRIEIYHCARALKRPDPELILKEGLELRKTAPLLIELGQISAQQDKKEEAESYLKEALSISPDRARTQVAWFKFLLAHDHFSTAIEAGKSGLGQMPDPSERAELLMQMAHAMAARSADSVIPDAETRSEGAPIPNAAVVSMVKDEEDIIGSQLEHHYRQGFRFFAIADNGSTDLTSERITAFRHAHPDVTCLYQYDPIVGYYQSRKTTALARCAREYFGCVQNIEWIFPLDADEFITLPADGPDLAEVLQQSEQLGTDILVYHLCNCATPTPLEKLPPVPLEQTFTIRGHFAARTVFKVAYRYRDSATLLEGAHFVVTPSTSNPAVRILAEDGIYLRHYPYRSIDQIRSKIVKGARAVNEAKGVVTGGHWLDAHSKYVAQGEPWLNKWLTDYISVTAQSRRPTF